MRVLSLGEQILECFLFKGGHDLVCQREAVLRSDPKRCHACRFDRLDAGVGILHPQAVPRWCVHETGREDEDIRCRLPMNDTIAISNTIKKGRQFRQAFFSLSEAPSDFFYGLYWLLRTSVLETGLLGFRRHPLSLCQVGLSHRSRKGIVLVHERKHLCIDSRPSGKAYQSSIRGLPMTCLGMTL